MLPSKTIPELSRKGHTRTQKAKGKMPAAAPKKKARTHSTDGSKVDDGDGPFPNIMRDASIFSTDSSTTHAKTVCSHYAAHTFISIIAFIGSVRSEGQGH